MLLLFIHWGKEDMGRSVFIVLGMILLAIRIRWDLRRHVWFWVVIVLLLGLHVPLFFVVQWPHGWLPAVGLLPIGLADCLIILSAVHIVEKFIVRATPRIAPE